MIFESPEIRVESLDEWIRIYRQGENSPILVQNAEKDKRPFIHPIIAPDRVGVLTENAPIHHLWQHGLYVGLNDINGIGFWSEGYNQNPKDGTFHPKPLQTAVVNGNKVTWTVETEWLNPTGGLMITEIQHWSFFDRGDVYELDLKWTLCAEMDLVFGQYGYGGLFLRMPYREGFGGKVTSSEELTNGAMDGQRARWVSLSMPIQGRSDHAGIALMDHPDNPEHPVPWRIDLQLGISPSRCIAGEWKLSQGKSQEFKHRIYVFCGETNVSEIESGWKAYIEK